ncbi:hypothetical protein [Acetobacter sp. UBA5411]|uniref:hypothetical protein n=1 Tax=Acetobacter sp. UBA5411 TaxID=1945905 RepID=UPI0025B92CF5|nr:hypothetical protein [Acetobacter sp. UBA5411]
MDQAKCADSTNSSIQENYNNPETASVFDIPIVSASAEARFLRFVDIDGPMHPEGVVFGQCHVWMGCKLRTGYGRFRIAKAKSTNCGLALAHRVARALAGYPLFRCETARHSCNNPSCVNPEHILAGSRSDNITDRELWDRNVVKRGQYHHKAVLEQEDVVAIKNDYRSSRQIAISYNVSLTTITRIKNGEGWKNIRGSHVVRPSHSETHYAARLTNTQVVEIRNSSEKASSLAKKFHVDVSTIYAARSGKTYKHVLQEN